METAITVVFTISVHLLVISIFLWFAFGGMWHALAKEFPSREVSKPSISKPYQSFKINTLNLGRSGQSHKVDVIGWPSICVME